MVLYRHHQQSLIWTMLLLFSLTLLFSMMLTALSTKQALTLYYTDRQESTFLPYEYQLTVDQSAQSRFFSIQALKNHTASHATEFDYIAFFETQILLKHNEEFVYANLFASDLPTLKEVVKTAYVHDNLLNDEMIISLSLSQDYGIALNDTVTVLVGSTEKMYKVVSIETDQKFFKQQAVFVSKDSLIRLLITEINPSLSALPSSVLANLYNSVYIRPLSEDKAAIEVIKLLPGYQNLLLEPTINYETISQMIDRNVALFELMMSLVTVAIIGVLYVVFLIHYKSVLYRNTVLTTLGASKRLIRSLGFSEWTLFIGLSLFFGLMAANGFLNWTLNQFSNGLWINIPLSDIGLSLAIVIGIMLLGYALQVKDHRSKVHVTKMKYLIPLSISLTLFLTIHLLVTLSEWIVIPLLILWLLTILYLLIVASQRDLKKPTKFKIFKKAMHNEKGYGTYLFASTIILASVALMLQGNHHIHRRMETFMQEYQWDILVTRFTNPSDQLKNEILLTYPDTFISEALYMSSVTLVDSNDTISMVIRSIDASIFEQFNVYIPESMKASFYQSESLSVLLPKRYEMVNGLKVGDEVTLHLSETLGTHTFKVLGFYPKINDNLAFIHIPDSHQLYATPMNALFIQSDEPNVLRQELIKDYSKHLIAILSFEDVTQNVYQDMKQAVSIMNTVLMVIAMGFVFGLINQSLLLYQSMKPELTTLRVLGYSRKTLLWVAMKHAWLEGVIVIVIATALYMVITSLLTPLALRGGQYEYIHYNAMNYVLLFSVLIGVYVLAKITFLIEVTRTKASSTFVQ